MAFHTHTQDPIGMFVEAEVGNYFEYSVNDDFTNSPVVGWANDYPHKVWVGSEGVCGDQGYRYAHVKKTVAYIITDEDECGQPVVERWKLKKNTTYSV